MTWDYYNEGKEFDISKAEKETKENLAVSRTY